MREAVANGEMSHVPVSSSASLESRGRVRQKPLTALVEAKEAHTESTGPFQDRVQSIHSLSTTRGDREGTEVQGGSKPKYNPQL